jgi:hypothetical protein
MTTWGAAAGCDGTKAAAATGEKGAMLHPEVQGLADIAGPEVLVRARWQQHLARQQAEATEEVSHCALIGEREANQSSSATGTAAARRVQ